MRVGQWSGLYARPPRPTLDGPGPDVHLHDLYAAFAVRSWKFLFSDNGAGRQHSLLSPLDCLSAKAVGAVNGGAYAPFILTVDWLGRLCYEFRPYLLVLREFVDTPDYQIKAKSRCRFPFLFSSYQIVVLRGSLFHHHPNGGKEDNLVASILLA